MTTWENRCYLNGIPDEVPEKISKSARVPSYKSIALCLLNNDLNLCGLGFSGKETGWYSVLKSEKKQADSDQIILI